MAEEVLTVARMGAKDETGPAFRSIQNNMRNTVKQSQAVNNQFRLLRGGAGQVGHQIQDIAVQLSMGTNAMIVFGQQGSQIASLMGPKGAMIGAVLAVGAAIGVAFTRDVKKAENELNALEEHIKDQIEITGKLKDEYIDLLTIKFAKDIEDEGAARVKAIKTLKEQRQVLQESKNAQKLLTNAKQMDLEADQRSALAVRDFTKEQKDANLAIAQAEAQIEASAEKVVDLQKKLGALAEGKNPFIDFAKESKKSDDAFERYIKSLDKATVSTAGGAVAAKAYELSLLGLEGAQLDAALAALGRYEQSLLDAEADKEAAKAAKERTAAERAMFEQAQKGIIQGDEQRRKDEAAERKRRAAQIDRLRTFDDFKKELGDTFLQMRKLEDGLVGVTENAMANFTDSFYDAISGAKNFKDAFKDMARSIVEDLSKMLIQYYITQQIFGAITSMFPGSGTSNQANTPTGIPFGPAGGMPSGNGGGFTGYGSRSGGLDGKGGFAAILHPNETVIDHTKGQGQGVTIVQNINVSTGVQQTVRAEIANLLPQISNAAKSAVADARLRGGGFSKAMVGT